MTKHEFKKFIEEWRMWYKQHANGVCCPCLNINIVFNSKGFYHIRCSSPGKDRTVDEQIVRMQLLPNAVRIITQSKQVFSYRKVETAEYWCLQDEISGRIIRVILRRSGSNQIVFHSVFEKK